MSRESRDERIVKAMHEAVTECLHEFKVLVESSDTKEADVERWCESFLKTALGYSASSGYVIKVQEKKGKHRPDIMVYKKTSLDKPEFVIEVKKLGADLTKSDLRTGKLQLQDYLSHLSVQWGILTNGYEWFLFSLNSNTNKAFPVLTFDIRNEEETVEVSKRVVEELCWELLDVCAESYERNTWADLAKESEVFSPTTLAKAILSDEVIKRVAKKIRGEYDFRVKTEVLTDKVRDLLVLGLNEVIVGWNDAQRDELEKYVRAQKRAGRRTRRAVKREKDATNTVVPVANGAGEVAAVKTPESMDGKGDTEVA